MCGGGGDDGGGDTACCTAARTEKPIKPAEHSTKARCTLCDAQLGGRRLVRGGKGAELDVPIGPLFHIAGVTGNFPARAEARSGLVSCHQSSKQMWRACGGGDGAPRLMPSTRYAAS